MIPFERALADLIRSCGFVPVRGGWPDYAVFTAEGRLVGVIEAKAAGDAIRPTQHLILQALVDTGIKTLVAHPGNQGPIADWLFGLPGQSAVPPSTRMLVGAFVRDPTRYAAEHLPAVPTKQKAPKRTWTPYRTPEERLHRALTRTYLTRGRLIQKAAGLMRAGAFENTRSKIPTCIDHIAGGPAGTEL